MEAIRIIKFKNYEIKRNLIENLPYNPKLKEFAKNLRKSRNLAEVLFWNEVKSKKFHSLDFDRQRVIDNYIVDFYVKILGLVIEIDGWYHEFKKDKDEIRQKYLESLGIKFFRVSDFDVKKNMMLILQDLENFIVENYKL